jgi:hypothetical protein
MEVIQQQASAIPDLSLVIVDTVAAYFRGDDGNSNAQMGAYARLLRQLTTLPGKPAVIAPAHPIKNAAKDNLLPMGGSAFLNEVDGNLTLWADIQGEQTTLHHGKIRGPEFEPMMFKLETVHSDRVVNAQGEMMPSVMASPITEFEADAGAAEAETDENVLMGIIGMNKPMSYAQLASKANWIASNGQPSKSKVQKVIDRLKADKFVVMSRQKPRLTSAGRKEIGFDE